MGEKIEKIWNKSQDRKDREKESRWRPFWLRLRLSGRQRERGRKTKKLFIKIRLKTKMEKIIAFFAFAFLFLQFWPRINCRTVFLFCPRTLPEPDCEGNEKLPSVSRPENNYYYLRLPNIYEWNILKISDSLGQNCITKKISN